MILKNILFRYLVIALLFFATACYEEENLNVPVKETPDNVLNTELDIYIEDNFTTKYDMAIRYRYVDRYVAVNRRVTPPRLDVVRPMLDFIENYWIDPYLEVENGEGFFKTHVPPEIIFLGGPMYNTDGTRTLGIAEAGARITLVEINDFDPEDEEWRSLQLGTIYHEFAHIVHQRYKLPDAFETISPTGYTSPGSWFNLPEEEALMRGFVSPYATSNPNEDFAETVSVFLYDEDFYETYINLEPNCTTAACEARNTGRRMIDEKLSSIIEHYEKATDIDLEELRSIIQSKL